MGFTFAVREGDKQKHAGSYHKGIFFVEKIKIFTLPSHPTFYDSLGKVIQG